MSGLQLYYFIFTEGLSYALDGKRVEFRAMSGGNRGQRDGTTGYPYGKHDENALLSRDVQTQEDEKNQVAGGPIPPGDYSVGIPYIHPELRLAAKLEPSAENDMYDRKGFYIHGRGQKGSEGCIVPIDPAQFQNLMTALTQQGGGSLKVLDDAADIERCLTGGQANYSKDSWQSKIPRLGDNKWW